MQFKEAPALELGPSKRTTDPIVTGSSVVALRYKDGIMMIADTLASYGSMAMYKDVQRITKINGTTVLGGSGEYSDFQFINKFLEELTISDFCMDDGKELSPNEVHSYLARVLYNRRSRVNPLYNQLIVGGFKEGKSFLGLVDMYGSNFEENILATGYGAYMAIPLLRAGWKENMTEAEARQLITDAVRVLYYRDCRAINRYTLATVTQRGVDISDPFALSEQWSYKLFINPGSATG